MHNKLLLRNGVGSKISKSLASGKIFMPDVRGNNISYAKLGEKPESLDAGDFAALLQIIAGVGAN